MNTSSVKPKDAAAQKQRAASATVIFVAFDRKLAGFVAIADPIKPTVHARRLSHATMRHIRQNLFLSFA
ncbi:hypothetical protein GCM10028796_02100 [Ramlibacter monticola]